MLGRTALLVTAALLATPARALGARAVLRDRPPAQTAETIATFTFDATPGGLFPSFECQLDGGPWERCVSPRAVANLTGGPHRFAVRLSGLFVDRTADSWDWAVTVPTQDLPCGPDATACVNPVRTGAGGVADRPDRRRDARGCAYGANRIDEVPAARLAHATVCVINRERGDRGLKPVRANAALALASRRHARDMVARRYFAHQTPGGASVADRAQRAGYLRGARYWALGEVLAWSAVPPATPERIVAAWLRSSGHRRVMLTASYRDVGVGAVAGTPLAGRTTTAATFAAVFGRR